MSHPGADDVAVVSSSNTDPSRLLPEELWRLIFSRLTDYQLCISVVPVCRLFRQYALSILFRDLDDDGGVNLGHDWTQWHHVPFDLLRHCGIAPRRLEFRISEELISFHKDPSIEFRLGMFDGASSAAGEFPDSGVLSGQERRKMIEAIAAFPRIERLRIEHRSFETVRSPPPATTSFDEPAFANRRVSPRNAALRQPLSTCAASLGGFLEEALSPCRESLKELDLRLRCICPRVSPRRRQNDVSHSDRSWPQLTSAHVNSIGDCAALSSLTLRNRPSCDALSIFARRLPNLESLRLMDGSLICPSRLTELGALIGENPHFFEKLKSLRLEGLDGLLLPPYSVDDFFATNPALCQRLTCLGIEYAVYQREDVDDDQGSFDFNRVFRSCFNLEELHLHVALTSAPDFSKLLRLRLLRYLQLGWLADARDLAIEPSAPDARPSNFLAQLPAMVDLTIRLYDLPPPGCSDDYLRRCLEGLRSLHLMDTERRHASRYVRRVLSVCRKSLRAFKMGRLRDPEPLRDVTDSDFPFVSLDVGEGGEILFENLAAPHLRNLVRFRFCVENIGDRERPADAAPVRFVERVCDASADSLRNLEVHCYFPMERMEFISGMKKLENLRLFVYTLDVKAARVLQKFVGVCNRLFPVDRHDVAADFYLDELSAFPAMKEFVVTVTLGSDVDGQADSFSYTIRKTCFGQVKRFLGMSGDFPVCIETAQFTELDPLDVLRDAVPELPVN